jgi:hypothetical protein
VCSVSCVVLFLLHYKGVQCLMVVLVLLHCKGVQCLMCCFSLASFYRCIVSHGSFSLAAL